MAVGSALGSPEASVPGSSLCAHVAISVQLQRRPARRHLVL